MHRFTLFTVLAAVAMLTEATPGRGYYSRKSYKKPKPAAPCSNLVDVAVSLKDDGFSTLVSLVVELGLADALRNINAATVFAPTDAAFSAIAGKLAGLDIATKTKIVKRHVLGQTVKSTAIRGVLKAETLSGEIIKVVKDGAGVGVSFPGGSGDRSNVVKADVGACNGVIHAIDRV